MMAKILVTGGPVHAHLDSVKVVTNRFKGGRMVALAEALREKGHFVTFIGSPYGKVPSLNLGMLVEVHQGFADYRQRVRENAPENDMVILGAAVANLIPIPPWDVTKKFPSHDYNEGDEIMVPFRVAPRVINEVKKANPRTTLVGFKLLQGVSKEELVRAAYTVNTEANAAFVIANDADDLSNKLIVTRERSVIPALDVTVGRPEKAYLESIGSPEILVDFLDQVARDEHYSTDVHPGILGGVRCKKVRERTLNEALDRYDRLVERHRGIIEGTGTVGDMVFGCIAVAVEEGGFVISERGKSSIASSAVYVSKVDHNTRRVVSHGGKPSLNAPFIDWLLRNNPHMWGVLHHHGTGSSLPSYPYAPPGTVRDSQRSLADEMEFEIAHHGTFKLLTKGECDV